LQENRPEFEFYQTVQGREVFRREFIGIRRLALERLFEIISVASDYIPASLKVVENDVDWQAIADIGGRLENTRDRIETYFLWTIWQGKLTPLKTCAERHLRNLR